MGQGQGSITVNQARNVPVIPPATVTGANEGLSLAGTIVRLGAASILSALPTITVPAFIPIGNSRLTFTSSNIATPDNILEIQRNTLSIIKQTAGGSQPQLTLSDLSTSVTNVQTNVSIVLTGALPATSFIRVHNNANTNECFFDSQRFVCSTPAHTLPSFQAVGTNAAGSVFASQFRNASTSAAASVVSQWFVDSTVQDFEIVKYSNANVASGNPGGVDLVHNNAGVPTAMLRLMASSATAIVRATIGGGIFLNLDRGGGTYQLGDVNAVANATTITAEDVTSRVILKATTSFIYQNQANVYFQVDTATANTSVAGIGKLNTLKGRIDLFGNTSGTISIQPQAAAGTYNFNLPITAGAGGDLLTSGGGGGAPMTFTDPTTLPYIKNGGTTTATSAITIDINSAQPFVINNGGSVIFSLDGPTGAALYKMGDVDNNMRGTFITVDDTNGVRALVITSNNATGGILTDAGTTAGASKWCLGSVIANVAVLDATQYAEVDINGVLVKLAMIV